MDALGLRDATVADLAPLLELINRAFELEREFIDGDRLDDAGLRDLRLTGDFVLAHRGGALVAAVYVAVRGERGYFGLLSVAPTQKGRGLGRALVAAAEARCRAQGCVAMDLKVVDLRRELPPFYERLGYRVTGTLPFPADEAHRLKQPAHFITMSRPL